MSDTSQKRAIRNYRSRLHERGMARFEVLGRSGDRELVRSFARRLAEGGPQAEQLRSAAHQGIADPAPRKGGILQALRHSPLVGAGAVPARRSAAPARKVEL